MIGAEVVGEITPPAKGHAARARVAVPPAGIILAMLFLAVVTAMAFFPALFTPLSPGSTDADAILGGPSAQHPFGTDSSGRDVYARVVYGAAYSLGVGAGATLGALVAGIAVGNLAALSPRIVDGILSRLIEVLMAFPEFLIALFVLAFLGPGPVNVAVAVGIAAIPAYARVARAETLRVRGAGFVEAARGQGHPFVFTVMRHIIPNTFAPLGVIATIGIGTAIVSAAGLSFLGLGPQEPTAEWGLILSSGRNYLANAPWIAVFPGLFISGTVISATVLGRWLRKRAEGDQS